MSQYAFLKHMLMRYSSVNLPENARRTQPPSLAGGQASEARTRSGGSMNSPSPDHPPMQEPLERPPRIDSQRPGGTRRTGTLRISTSDRHAEEARRGEWSATPPGRLGRRLLADIELYLEFFAIARAD
jgi:hypothetical protein